jgi:hypothetical protein
MSIVLAGAWVLLIFVVTALVLAVTIFASSFTQGEALREAAFLLREQVHASISIASTTNSTAGGATTVTIPVDNTGLVTVVRRQQMDVIVKYIGPDGTLHLKWLPYVASDPPGNDQWTIASISPDAFNPGLWDPGERATFKLKVSPVIPIGNVATVLIATPNGVSDSISFTGG